MSTLVATRCVLIVQLLFIAMTLHSSIIIWIWTMSRPSHIDANQVRGIHHLSTVLIACIIILGVIILIGLGWVQLLGSLTAGTHLLSTLTTVSIHS